MRALNVRSVIGLCVLFFSSAILANPELESFADSLAQKHQLNKSEVMTTLATAKKNQNVLDAIARPWEAKPWYQYYPIFLTEKRVEKGVEFWRQHQATLDKAEQELGVPAEMIVAIIGVETFYGTYKGKYSVLDALYTLGFYYPPRAKFFKSELEQLFLLSAEEKLPITSLNGSYAGAMGWGQFISSSYRHYAIDFDQDGVRDLLNNPVDAIGSVANYFKQHGWNSDEPVAYPASVSGDKYKELVTKSLKYQHDWRTLSKAGVSLNMGELAPDTSTKLLQFEQADGHEYWVGLPNFYVITRYNHSPLYAMAVYQLSQQIKTTMEAK